MYIVHEAMSSVLIPLGYLHPGEGEKCATKCNLTVVTIKEYGWNDFFTLKVSVSPVERCYLIACFTAEHAHMENQ
jgi:hypothetical protein